MSSRCVMLLLDGLGDRYHAELGGTPLQAAETPNLDLLASLGANGLFHADGLGVALSSPDAHLAMYGYHRDEVPARSILEALGYGIPFDPEEVLLCARLGSGRVENGILMVSEREPTAEAGEVEALMAEVARFSSDGIRFELAGTTGARHVLKLAGPVSPLVTDADTHRTNVPLAAVKPLKEAERHPRSIATAQALNEYLRWASLKLGRHKINRLREARGDCPLNVLLTYFAGVLKGVPSLAERWGLGALTITSKPVQWGIASLVGMDAIKAPHREDPEEEIAERIDMAAAHLGAYDFIHVHTMAPDDAAHTKNPQVKKEIIEALDRGIGRAIKPLIDDPEVLLVVTSDHSTPSSGLLVHSGEPVPLTFVGRSARRDRVERFNEVDCATGALGMVRGSELMWLILDQLERTMLRELRHTPELRPYRQDDYSPLEIGRPGRKGSEDS